MNFLKINLFEIIRNACLNDKWGTEETEHGGFPLKKGEKFDLVILNNTIDLEVHWYINK